MMRMVEVAIPPVLTMSIEEVAEAPPPEGVGEGVAIGTTTVTAITAYLLKCITEVLTVPVAVSTTPPMLSQ